MDILSKKARDLLIQGLQSENTDSDSEFEFDDDGDQDLPQLEGLYIVWTRLTL